MTGNIYLMNVLRRKRISSEGRQMAFKLARRLYPHIRKVAGQYLSQIVPSGSYAKGTGVKGRTDMDLLISFKNKTPGTLKDIYNSFYNYFNVFFLTRKQNVSIRVNYGGKDIDLVPARKMPYVTYPHSIWINQKGAWTKTNINRHISMVRNSKRQNEIILLKIWRDLNGLDFPSFYLELSVIEALKTRRIGSLERNLMVVFEYLIREFLNGRIVDPGNSANVISDDLSDSEKQKIRRAALAAYNEPSWSNVIW